MQQSQSLMWSFGKQRSRGKEKAEARIQTLAEEIRTAGELKKLTDERRRLSRAAAKRERGQMLERQSALEVPSTSEDKDCIKRRINPYLCGKWMKSYGIDVKHRGLAE